MGKISVITGIIWVFFIVIACSDSSKVSSTNARSGEDGTASDVLGAMVFNSEDQSSNDGDDEEIVATQPNVISGAYLICEEDQAIYCGLRKQGKKLRLTSGSFYFVAGTSDQTVSAAELEDSFWTFRILKETQDVEKKQIKMLVSMGGTRYAVAQREQQADAAPPPLPDAKTQVITEQISENVTPEGAGSESSSGKSPEADGQKDESGAPVVKIGDLPAHEPGATGLKTGLEGGLDESLHFDLDLVSRLTNSPFRQNFHAWDQKTSSNGIDFLNLNYDAKTPQLRDFLDDSERFYLVVVNAGENDPAYLRLNDNLFSAYHMGGMAGPADMIRPVFSLGPTEGSIQLQTFQLSFDDDGIEESGILKKLKRPDVDSDALTANGPYRGGALVIQFVKYDGTPLMIDTLTGSAAEKVILELVTYRH